MKNSSPTLRDIAQRAGVSIATVSRVINDPDGVNSELKNKVEKALKDLNYIPKVKNPNTKSSGPVRVGFLVNDFFDNAYMYLLRGILEAASSINIEPIIYETQRDIDKEISILKQIQNRNIKGIISVANIGSLNSEYQKLLSNRFPIVFIVNPNDPKVPLRDDINIIMSDSEGTHSATKYLLDLGHKDILFLGDSQIPRFTGYKRALESNGVSIDSSLVVDCSNNFEDANEYITKNFDKKRFTAILGAGENITIGCWLSLVKMNYKIPEDCSLIGFNMAYVSKYLSITSIAEPLLEIGKNAVYLLNECINNPQVNPRKIVLRDSLIIRDSCTRI